MNLSKDIGKILGRVFGMNVRYLFKAIHIQTSLATYSNYLNKHALKIGTNCRVYSPQSIKGCKYMSIGNNFKLGESSIIEAWDQHNNEKFSPRISIGNDVSFGRYSHIGSINSITIGNGVLTGANVLIIDHAHGQSTQEDLLLPPNKRKLYSAGPIRIGDNVWLGDRVIVLPGVTIGKNAIIGAGAVVTCDIPDNSVACGVPAKVVKQIK